MKFELHSIEGDVHTSIEFDSTDLNTILSKFEMLLKASGFVLNNSEHIVLWDEDIEQLTAIAEGEWKDIEEDHARK